MSARKSDIRLPAYLDYDVLDKRTTPSWDEPTRAVIDDRMRTPDEPAWCNLAQWATLRALCETIIPQPKDREQVLLAALVDRKIARGKSDGYRNDQLPPLQDAWRIALAALDEESHSRRRVRFADLDDAARIELIVAMERGLLHDPAWQKMSPKLFFSQHVLHDICTAYYAHPYTWSDIGFGGPANPRGYVRMDFNRRDPWEAVEAKPNESRLRKRTRHAR